MPLVIPLSCSALWRASQQSLALFSLAVQPGRCSLPSHTLHKDQLVPFDPLLHRCGLVFMPLVYAMERPVQATKGDYC
jgi:hypothetical protein